MDAAPKNLGPQKTGKDRVALVCFGSAGLLILSLILCGVTLEMLKQRGWTRVPVNAFRSYTVFQDQILFDSTGQAYVLGRKHLWVLTQAGIWQEYNKANGHLTGAGPISMAVDPQDQLWVGYRNNGLAVISPTGRPGIHYAPASGLGTYEVDAVAFGGDGRVWVGTAKGLRQLDTDGNWKTFKAENPRQTQQAIQAVVVDQQDRVWIGTRGAVERRNPDGRWEVFPLDNPTLFIRTLLLDRQGRLWIGTNRGLYWLDSNGSVIRSKSDYVEGVIALTLDHAGQVWVGSSYSVSRITPDGSWTSFTSDNSGVGGGHTALAVSPQGTVWIGGRGGIRVLDPAQVIYLGELPSIYKAMLCPAVAAILGLGTTGSVRALRQKRKRIPQRAPAPMPAWQPAAAAPGLNLPAEERERVLVLLDTFRRGDPHERQQALAELERLGQVEEF